jgi:hypothetical protein
MAGCVLARHLHLTRASAHPAPSRYGESPDFNGYGVGDPILPSAVGAIGVYIWLQP